MGLILCSVFYPETGIIIEISLCKLCDAVIQRIPNSKNKWCLQHNEEYLLRQ